MALLYQEAGAVLKSVCEDRVGLRQALYSTDVVNVRKVMPLVSSVLRILEPLKAIFLASGFAVEEDGKLGAGEIGDPYSGLVMAYDVFIGKKGRTGGAVKRVLESRRTEFEALKVQSESNVVNNTSVFPRYVRMRPGNSSAEVLASLESDGVTGASVMERLPEVLRMPVESTNKLRQSSAAKEGKIVLQDLSGCLSGFAHDAHIAGIKKKQAGKIVLMDVCAAPGNKTLHLLDLIQKHSLTGCSGERVDLLVCEMDPKRAQTLCSRLMEVAGLEEEIEAEDDSSVCVPSRVFLGAGVKVSVFIKSFFDLDPLALPFSEVTHLNLDPSCSGSGLPLHFEKGGGQKGEEESLVVLGKEEADDFGRIEKLSVFQEKMLVHAMKFPSVQCLCYSTCSLYLEENFQVVRRAMEQLKRIEGKNTSTECVDKPQELLSFRSVRPLPPSSWPDKWRGVEEVEGVKGLQVRPDVHECRGFFLARLERSPGWEGEALQQRKEILQRMREERKGKDDLKGEKRKSIVKESNSHSKPAKKEKLQEKGRRIVLAPVKKRKR